MVAHQDSTSEPPAGPEDFRSAVASMSAVSVRREVHLEPMPAPQRIAPWSSALSADVTVDDEDLGTGRLILLHDPDGNDAWGGTYRCVAYGRAELDAEVGNDPMLAGVGWSWLTDALDGHGAGHHSLAGTVTCVSTESFGQMDDEEGTAQIEIRASWTPETDEAGALDMGPHVEAWAELLCTAVGLAPVPEGVTSLDFRRGQRGA